jgi:DNA-binding FadR family transcriptional regulator
MAEGPARSAVLVASRDSRGLIAPTALSPVPGARDPKLAERVAAAIEADIVRAGWPVGDVVGSEEQLIARYGVGRAVIREAMRLAEHRQIVRPRRGRNGGLVVVEPDQSAVTESLAVFLEYARADLADVLEARTVLEAFSAAAAATSRPGEALLAELRQAAQLAPDCATPGAERFHEGVARLSGNAALSLFIVAIAALSERLSVPLAAEICGDSTSGASHPGIVAAIAVGDVGKADARMRADMVSLGQVRRPRDSAQEPAVPKEPKRPADAIAARIIREIIDRGWPVGESLGFEPDLMERYGIGRAQFREAARILENHSVIRMQRGAAGGMVVAAPDGRAIVRTVSLYLTYQGMNARHIRDLRAQLEAVTLRLAIERLTPEGVARLNGVVELERTWPDDDFPAVSHDLHAVIAELSGNLTLGLLQSIAMQLTAERLHSGDPHRVTEPPDAVRRAHKAIVQAIVARDVELALRRMSKHLGAIARWTVDNPAPPR